MFSKLTLLILILSQTNIRYPLRSRLSTLDPDEFFAELEQKIQTLAHSETSSLNLSNLAERLSLTEEGDEISEGGSVRAPSENRETLLKFIMRVNKKREMVSVGCQTAGQVDLVASNYQELHSNSLTTNHTVEEESAGTVREMVQIHAGDISLSLLSAQDTTLKVTCGQVGILDGQWEKKARGVFPDHRFSAVPGEARIRVDIVTDSDDIMNHSDQADQSGGINCEVILTQFSGSLQLPTLEGLSAFIAPDPTLPSTLPFSLSCFVVDTEVDIALDSETTKHIIVPRLRVGVERDESVHVGRTCCGVDLRGFKCACESELDRLRRENEELKRLLLQKQ
eukprot:sb/3466499/